MAQATTDKGRFFIIGLNREQARNWCRKAGVKPYSREVVMIGDAQASRGHRLRHEDQVIILRDARRRKDWFDLRAMMLPTGVDIDQVPAINA